MNRRLFRWIFTFSAIFSACSTDDAPMPDTNNPPVSVDFRDVLIGNYSGTKNNYYWSMNPANIYDTTYAWSFTIAKDTADSSIIADGVVFKLDSTLSFHEMTNPGQIKKFDFSNDSAIMFFRSGGLGGFSS
ncbi:MAG: hypothetical protein ACKOQY_08550, partial [Bacteroidota bacterium]